MPTSWTNHPRAKALWNPLRWGVLAGLAMALFTLFMPNQYKSEARILPADARGSSGLGGLAAAAAAVGVSIPGQESADAAYVDILNSRWLRERLLQKTYRFQERSWYLGGLRAQEMTLLQYLKKPNLDRGLQALRAHIVVNRDFKTKLLTISVETSSSELSQQIAQDMVKSLEEFVLVKATSRGGAKANFAANRLVESRKALAEAEDEFRRFAESHRNYQISTDPSTRLEGLRLEAEFKLRTQMVTTLAIAHEQALLEEKNDMPILNVLDAGNLPLEKSGPARSQMVLMTTGLVSLLIFLVQSRAKILSTLEE